RGPRAVSRVWATERAAHEDWLSEAGPEPASGREIERLSGSPDHQGVCAEVSDYEYADPGELLASEDAVVVALDQVQDPQNLGAICRVAECAGAAGVVTGERRAAQVTAAVCRASAGAGEPRRVARGGNRAALLAPPKHASARA